MWTATTKPILLTARDVGAYEHLIILAQALNQSGVGTHLILQGAAQAQAAMTAHPHDLAIDWLGNTAAFENGNLFSKAALARCSERFEALDPVAVICGLSAFHSHGIDESIMLIAKDRGVPSFAMQDFWGDVKTVNGYCADHYFVIDELAARLTAERTSAAVHVVGSIKHGRFSEFEYSKKRADFRKEFNLGASEPAIGYFGQDLSRIEGYQLVLSDIALAIEAIGGARLIYRPHPLEDNASITLSLDIFKKRNIKLILAPNKSLDDVLAGVDVALSCFSTVGLDAAYLVRSKGAGPAIVYANYPEDIRSYWQRGSGLSNVPLVDEGCALSARNGTDLILALKEALRPGKARVLFERIQKQLPRQETAIDKAVSVIFNVLQK